MAHFYLRDDLADAEPGGAVELRGAEARHAVAVSRTRPGEAMTVGNGRGLVVRGTVTTAESTLVTIAVDTVEHIEPPTTRLMLAQALAKGGRDELAVQTATELGVDVVVPWMAARSIVRWTGEKQRKGVERWAAVVREAGKQSMRAWLPTVQTVADTAELARRAAGARLLVLDPMGRQPLSGIRPDHRDLLLVVGPEGGIGDDELRQLEAAGAERVRLGETVLRTSSAGPAAIAVLNVAMGRW